MVKVGPKGSKGKHARLLKCRLGTSIPSLLLLCVAKAGLRGSLRSRGWQTNSSLSWEEPAGLKDCVCFSVFHVCLYCTVQQKINKLINPFFVSFHLFGSVTFVHFVFVYSFVNVQADFYSILPTWGSFIVNLTQAMTVINRLLFYYW
jgi:hypothetical protein